MMAYFKLNPSALLNAIPTPKKKWVEIDTLEFLSPPMNYENSKPPIPKIHPLLSMYPRNKTR